MRNGLFITGFEIKKWYNNNKLHRLNGPAYMDMIYRECMQWYYNGKYIRCSSQEEFERLIKLRLLW
jgi:hypothetical protein